MRTGLCDDLQEIDDARKTAVIDHELHRLGIDSGALQETRLPDRSESSCADSTPTRGLYHQEDGGSYDVDIPCGKDVII